MRETYSILCSGLKEAEKKFALSHFSKMGHKVLATGSSSEARNELENKKIDLMYLRVMEGENPADKLKEIFAISPSLPVVCVCNKVPENFILNAWRSGASDILILPLTDQSLDSTLNQSIKRSLSSRPGSQSQIDARFFYLDEDGKECRVDIASPKFTLGRSSSNDLVMSIREVSRFHAEVSMSDGEYFLRDLGSKMGTYVNGIKTDQAQLKNGDRIQLGSLQSPNISFHQGDLLQGLLSRSSPKHDVGLSFHDFKDIGKLFAVFQALSSIPVLDDLLAYVLDYAIELTGSERGFVMLKEQGDSLSFRCARNNKKQSLEGEEFQTSQRVPHEVIKKGKPVVINDLNFGDNDHSHDSTRQYGLRSVCCVPLRYISVHEAGGVSTITQAETIGVLYVDSSSSVAGISKTKINALETLASEAAVAIYNAKLYTVSQDKRKMDEQLAVARDIQQALLPNPERDHGYLHVFSQSIPCYEIGGDFFDYFDLENNRFGFAIGDVAGKGMPAALLASLIQGVLSAQNLNHAPLAEIIGRVNRNLAGRGPGNRFVTFFFGILDRAGNCSYVNAGHNPPLLLSTDGSLQELTVGGMVLGLFGEAQYETGTVRLKQGDRIVLFTDGVVEALNSEGEEFELERLVALLKKHAQSSAAELLSRVREAVLAFSTHAPQHDDITLMVLELKELSPET